MNLKYRKIMIAIAVFSIAGFFVWTVYFLFELRFAKSDVHKNYSTFRADPMGCKAVYESFNKMSGVNVFRHLRPVSEIENPKDATLVLAGVMSDSYITSDRELFNFVLKGGRLVVLFSPDASAPLFYLYRSDGIQDAKSSPKPKDTSRSEKDNAEEKLEATFCSEDESGSLKRLRKGWGFELEKYRRSLLVESSISPLEKSRKEFGFSEISFYSPVNLRLFHGDWIIHYSHEGKPVIAERYYGRGSLLLSSACYFVSNEALSKKPQLNLLLHVFLKRKNIYFYELHHGLRENRNIVWLAGKYKLGLLALNLLLIVVLYVWKSLFSISGGAFQDIGEKRGKIQSDFNCTYGLSNLLKRSVKRKGLVLSCVKEWKKTIKYRNISQRNYNEIRKIAEISDAHGDQADIYNKISEIILNMKARKK